MVAELQRKSPENTEFQHKIWDNLFHFSCSAYCNLIEFECIACNCIAFGTDRLFCGEYLISLHSFFRSFYRFYSTKLLDKNWAICAYLFAPTFVSVDLFCMNQWDYLYKTKKVIKLPYIAHIIFTLETWTMSKRKHIGNALRIWYEAAATAAFIWHEFPCLRS